MITVMESTFETWDQPVYVVFANVEFLTLLVEEFKAVYYCSVILLAMKLYVKLKVLPNPVLVTTI